MNPLTRTARLLTLALLFLSAHALRADDSLAHARQAQVLLGPEVWSQVIRIENDHPTATYPRTLHALVFEVADILWFYTASEGTQSFSRHRGRLTQEKADFAPLLRAIEPGFVRWTVVAAGGGVPGTEALRNACFIESVVALRERLLRGGEAVRPHLLSCYVETRTGLQGHTVLAYETGGRVEVIDFAQAGKRFHFSAALAHDALKLARAMLGNHVSNARFLPVDWPSARGYTSTVPTAVASMANSG